MAESVIGMFIITIIILVFVSHHQKEGFTLYPFVKIPHKHCVFVINLSKFEN